MKGVFFYVTVAVLVLITVGAAVFMLTAYPRIKEMASVRKMTINEVDLSAMKDGVFPGDFTYGGFTYEVEVVVRDHKIERVNVLKNREDSDYAKKAEGVIDRVIKSQSLKVDAVTGATTTSKALLKAIENALTAGLE